MNGIRFFITPINGAINPFIAENFAIICGKYLKNITIAIAAGINKKYFAFNLKLNFSFLSFEKYWVNKYINNKETKTIINNLIIVY